MIRFTLALFCLLLLLGGCARPPQPLPAELPAENLLARLAATTGRYQSLDATAKVTLVADGQRVTTQQFMLLERPDHLRIDALTGFGQLVLQLATDGKQLDVHLNHGKPARFLRGPASYENISRFVRIPLAVDDLLPLLLYDPLLIAFDRQQVSAASDGIVLALSGGDKQQELVFNEQLQLIACRYLVDGELLLAISYAKFSDAERFPHKVMIEIPRQKTDATVTISELSLNPAIDSHKFRLENPEDLPVERLP